MQIAIIEVDGEPDNLGPSFDRVNHFGAYPWHGRINPAGWLWGVVNAPWYYGTRQQRIYAHYIQFSMRAPRGALAQNSAGVPLTTVFTGSLANFDIVSDFLTGNANRVDWDVAYANIFIHEIFHHGVNDHTFHGFWSEPGDFNNGVASGSQLVDLSPFVDEIEEELD